MLKKRTLLGLIVALLSLNFLSAGCGAQVKKVSSPSPQTMVHVFDGGNFTFAWPTAWVRMAPGAPRLSIVDVPQGVLYTMPTGAQAQRWNLWLHPFNPKGGPLLSGSRLLFRWPVPLQGLQITAVTGGYALLKAFPVKGPLSFWAVRINKVSRLHLFNFSVPDPVVVAGRGAVAWGDGPDSIRVLRLADRKYREIKGKATDLGWDNGTVTLKGEPLSLPFLSAYAHPLPPGFAWASFRPGETPLLAVPTSWTVKRIIPGGSSSGIEATNPRDPNEQVTMWVNGCAGCYSPVQPPLGNILDSPLLSWTKGEKAVWLDNHTVATTLPPTRINPYFTYGLSLVPPGQGLVTVAVTVPPEDKTLATAILNTGWRP